MTNPAPEKQVQNVEGTFEVRVFQSDRAAAVSTETLTQSKEIENRLKELSKEHRLGDFIYTPEPGIHIYPNGTIHVRKL